MYIIYKNKLFSFIYLFIKLFSHIFNHTFRRMSFSPRIS
jgi:hypothetical protein